MKKLSEKLAESIFLEKLAESIFLVEVKWKLAVEVKLAQISRQHFFREKLSEKYFSWKTDEAPELIQQYKFILFRRFSAKKREVHTR